MKPIFLFAFLIFAQIINSQEISTAFGKVNIIDLNLKDYPNDLNADAVFLYDKGVSYFTQTENGFQVIFERSFKIKIFKKSAFKWAEVEIPYYFYKDLIETVTEIEAYTYNIENSAIKRDELQNKNIFDEKRNEYWRNKKFALPNIKEGSVIEVKYKITSPRIFDFRDWEFQTTIPTVYSEYRVKMVPFFTYNYILQGRQKFDVFETNEERGDRYRGMDYNNLVYIFGMRYIPALNDETFITSYNDCILKIDFQLSKVQYPDGYKKDIISTWPKLNNDLLDEPEFGKYLNASEKAGKKLLNLSELVTKPQKEQLESIINYVKLNYNWDEWYGIYTRKTLKEFQNEKTGNVANINLFLCGLFRAVGIEAQPVIISTRKNGKIKADYPFLHFFNYVIVLVNIDGKNILADATEPMCPFTHIPPRCINEKGLVVKKDEENWVSLTNKEPSIVTTNFNIAYNNNLDTINFKISSLYKIHEAYDIKEKYKDDIEKIKSSLLEKTYFGIDSIETKNYSENLKDYYIKFKGSVSAEHMDNKLYVSPFLNEPISINPLKQSTRLYPVDFIYPFGKKYISMIEVPKDYKTEFLPESIKIDNENIYIEYKIVLLDNNRLLTNGFYTFKKAVYPPEEYAKLKYYYNEIIKKFNEKVVLVKN